MVYTLRVTAGLALLSLGLVVPARSQWDVSQAKAETRTFSDAQARFALRIPLKWQTEPGADSTVFRWDNAAVTFISVAGASTPDAIAADAVARVKTVATEYVESGRTTAPIVGRLATSIGFTAKGPKGEDTRGRVLAIADPAVGLSVLLTAPRTEFEAANSQLEQALSTLTFGAAPPAHGVKLAERTRVKVRILEGLSSNHSKKGEEVRYEVVDDVLGPNREILIPKGAVALGAVTRASRRGIFGKPGKLNVSVEYVRAVDDTRVPLRANEDMSKSGKNNVTGVAAATILVAPLGLLINGRDASIKKGTEFDVFVNADTIIDVAEAKVASPASSAAGVQP